jgi:hypothetical protein
MSFFDSLLDRIRAMFETTRAPKIAASNRLGASSVGELSGALDELPNGAAERRIYFSKRAFG